MLAIVNSGLHIAISMGDPGGIGPEVIAKALAKRGGEGVRFTVYGCERTLRHAAATLGLTLPPLRVEDAGFVFQEPAPASANARSGEASFAWVKAGVMACLAGDADAPRALVTGPINKEAWALAGHRRYPGHTELLAELCGVSRYAMFFHAAAETGEGDELNVLLATVHVPLARVPGLLTVERVRTAIDLCAQAMRGLGVGSPRIGVCGLNPHAGEAGLLGEEDAKVIAPAVAGAQRDGVVCEGPLPGDTIFLAALAGRFDAVVAMYHDQGLIPVKLLARDRAVNVTVGLPFARTSPDHGTAFDIAGRGVAHEGSMLAAVRLAERFAAAGVARG